LSTSRGARLLLRPPWWFMAALAALGLSLAVMSLWLTFGVLDLARGGLMPLHALLVGPPLLAGLTLGSAVTLGVVKFLARRQLAWDTEEAARLEPKERPLAAGDAQIDWLER
jgi:hypothetical protein